MTQEPKWECFSDPSYFDMWCVRRVGDRTFGQGFHLVRQEGAEALCDYLNGIPDPAQRPLTREMVEKVLRAALGLDDENSIHPDAIERGFAALAGKETP